MIQSTCQAALHYGNYVEIFTDGPSFYPAMLDAIRSAARSINMELYIFQPGTVADQFISALGTGAARRQRHDRRRRDWQLQPLGPPSPAPAAGCRIESYQRFQWHSLARVNNRTHRELLIVDGRIAFVGGAGIADWWTVARRKKRRPWRDTMAGLRGPSWRRSSASRPRTGWSAAVKS